MRQYGTKGLQAFNLSLNQKANKVIVHKKRLTFARISLGALICISLLQLFITTSQMNITKAKLDEVFNDNTSTAILLIFSYISAIKIIALQFIFYILELPYISLAVTSTQMLVKYMYTYMSGDFLKTAVSDILELVDTDVPEADLEFSTVTTNISGCFLSIFLLFLFGLSWGPVLSLLLWSSSMLMPSFIQSTTDGRQALILDFVQVCIIISK